MHNDAHVRLGMIEYRRYAGPVRTRLSPVLSRSRPPMRTPLFLIPYNHLFSLAYFPHFLNSSGNSTHSSSSHFALRWAFFTSTNMSSTSSWHCARPFSLTPAMYANNAFFCLQRRHRGEQVPRILDSWFEIACNKSAPHEFTSDITLSSHDRSISSPLGPC